MLFFWCPHWQGQTRTLDFGFGFGIWKFCFLGFFWTGEFGNFRLWNLRFWNFLWVFCVVLCFHDLFFMCLILFLWFFDLFLYIISRFFKLLDIDKPMFFLSHIFTTKSGPHYKIGTPLQNQDLEPFFKSQQQGQKSTNWASTKWSVFTQAQKFINFTLLFSNQVPDFVEQFRAPGWWRWGPFRWLVVWKKGLATPFCTELARSEVCWNLIL